MIEKKCWCAAAALIVSEAAGGSYNGQATWHMLLNATRQKHEPVGSCFTHVGRWTCLWKFGKTDVKNIACAGENEQQQHRFLKNKQDEWSLGFLFHSEGVH